MKQALEQILSKLGIAQLNPMQQATSKAIGEWGDVVLISPTGSGKTLAYLLPLLSRLDKSVALPQVMIITPTRELSMQIEQVLKSMGNGFKINCCYGGRPLAGEKKSLQSAPAVIIGTPGRLLDHLRQGNLDISQIKTLVLDEFDKSLEMGFQEEMYAIIAQLKAIDKRILTSATRCEIPAFVGLTRPQTLDYSTEKKADNSNSPLTLYRVLSDQKDKLDTLMALLTRLEEGAILVFCNQRESVDRIYTYLNSRRLSCERFHGGMEQDDRERALTRFRNGSSLILISTDLASRGLDIPEVRHVIHYHLPLNEEAYIHRNGRTARMFANGAAYLILGPEEHLPTYVSADITLFNLSARKSVLPQASYITLYIGLGKKDKLNKVDVVGFLCQKGGLDKEAIGRIEIKEYHTYVAIDQTKTKGLLDRICSEKIKNKKTKFEFSEGR